MNLTIRATYPATDGSAPEAIEIEHDLTPPHAEALPYVTDHVREVIRALAAVAAGKVTPAVVVSVEPGDDDERLEIHVNGNEIASANHDDDGWAGMDRTVGLAQALARSIGGTFQDNR